ncbi:ATP-binding protein [Candidatus Azambacteria bacterium]|nr:ATP-binding protein [Candidatus Azambacteria bacterium]
MYSRIIKFPKDQSFFLFGPRGTGKTTWVKTTFPGAIYLDLLEAELFNNLLADPGRLSNFIPPDFKGWIIIDEIQRVPDLLYEIHRLIESRKYKFIITGSSPRKLKKTGPNLLAGRALTLSMYPLSVTELGADFNLKKSLQYGQMPSVYNQSDPKKYLEAYVKTYLEEEIQQEGLTRNLPSFIRFLESASFSQGSVLNVSSVARDCAVERKIVENYFSILEEMLIAYRIPVFSKKSKRRLVVHQKFYFFDTGVYRAIRPTGPLDVPEEVEGLALETLFLEELIAVNSALGLGYKIFYWRTSNKQEVDFVIYGSRGLLAFEIKRTEKINASSLSGLKSFLSDYPMAKTYFVYGGNRRLYDGQIEIIPILEMLKNLSTFI